MNRKIKIHAAERLIESQPIVDGENIQKTSGDRLCVELQSMHVTYRPDTLIKLTSKGGVDVFTHDTNTPKRFLYLMCEGKVIGYLKMTADRQIPGVKFEVTESYVKTKFRNQGLGTLLYTAAIKYFRNICSSANIGSMAVRTWRSLSKKFKVRLWCTTFSKEYSLEFNDAGIPVTDGKPIDKQREEYIFYIKGK